MENFPPNSARAKTEPQEEKKVERVTSEEPKRRKRSLRRQFRDTFMAGDDARTATQFVILSVLIPAARETMSNLVHQWTDRMIFGDHIRGGTRRGFPTTGPPGRPQVNYGRFSVADDRPPMPNMSPSARARFDFDEIVLASRVEAENVIDGMFTILSRYGEISVADLYGLCGIKPNHTDEKWGWTNLRGSGVSRTRTGFLLDLPEPEPLGI